jgi:hypothetical protein
VVVVEAGIREEEEVEVTKEEDVVEVKDVAMVLWALRRIPAFPMAMSQRTFPGHRVSSKNWTRGF